MFQDEARFGRIGGCRRCGCRRRLRLTAKKRPSRQHIYAFGAVSPDDGGIDTLALPQADTQCRQLFLDEVAARHADDNIVMVRDGAGWHTGNDLRAPANMRLLFLPPYSPKLNPVEPLGDELREKHFHNRVFDSLDAVEDHLVGSLHDFDLDQPRIRSITAWQWTRLAVDY